VSIHNYTVLWPRFFAAAGLTLLVACTESVLAQEPAPEQIGDTSAVGTEAAEGTRMSSFAVEGMQVYDGSSRATRVSLPRLSEPSIRIDGVLDDPAWARAAVLTGFTQFDPNEGIPAQEPTEVLVIYAPDALYIAILAFDSQPELIPAILTERDRGIFDDDYVRLMLDTFNDARQAYLFFVTPRGLQADGLWIEGLERGGGGGGGGGRHPIDLDPDFIWDSAGRVTEDGWVAEIRIPYVSLQLPARREQTWGFNAVRQVRRTSFSQSWSPLTREQTSTLAQSGQLSGLTDLAARKLIELNPVATGRLDAIHDGETLVRESVQPELGLDARYGVTRNLTLGATLNPDFSQIEADADQITVNERFAIFFDEKRPFFLDGTEVFNTPNRLVYTRRIIDPSGGAKLTGKVGSVDVGYLGALDRSPIVIDSLESEALFNMGRARLDIGAGSNIGGLYTDRTLLGGEGYNRVAAVDTRLLFGQRYSFTAQVAGAWTREYEEDGVPESAASRFGPLFSADLRRTGREFSWSLEFEDVHPDFETQTGFIRRVGDLRAEGSLDRSFFPEAGSAVESFGFQLRLDGFFDHDEFWGGEQLGPFEFDAQVEADVNFRGSRRLEASFRDGYFRFSPDAYDDYQVEGEDGELAAFSVPDPLSHMLAVGLSAGWRFSNALQFRGRLSYGETPIFSEASRGLELRLGPSFEIRPTASLGIDLSYSFSRIWRDSDGSFFSAADIPRLRLQYQFSRALRTRVVLQYDLQKREALRDPTTGQPIWIDGELAGAETEGDFLSQLLIAFEPSPRTTFFIGWSRTMEGDRTFDLGRMETMTEGFFAKLSYLFRL
jgi:hypothetical protein